MKPRFKDKMLDMTYQLLLGRTPEELHVIKTWDMDMTYRSFKEGYDGGPLPLYIARGTPNYAAYVAGKETRRC